MLPARRRLKDPDDRVIATVLAVRLPLAAVAGRGIG